MQPITGETIALKCILLCLLLLIALSLSSFAQNMYVEVVDIGGKTHYIEVDQDTRIRIRRASGLEHVTLNYIAGELDWAFFGHPDGTAQVLHTYTDGALEWITTHRTDSSRAATIGYKEGKPFAIAISNDEDTDIVGCEQIASIWECFP